VGQVETVVVFVFCGPWGGGGPQEVPINEWSSSYHNHKRPVSY
jgi:hypothetical protein